MSGLDLQWLVRSLLFLAAAIPTCLYAWARGGQPERVTAILVAAAIVGTTAIPQYSFLRLVSPLLVVDLLMLAGIVAVALCADRYWPLYFAAVHLLTVALHGVRAYDRDILPDVYARLGGELGYLAIAVLLVGTWRHARRGTEPDWIWQIERAG